MTTRSIPYVLTDALLLVLATTVIYYRYEQVKLPVPKNDIPYQFSAQLLQLPTTHANWQSFKLGQVFITTRYPPEFEYGDFLTVDGVLTTKMTMGYPKISIDKPEESEKSVSQDIRNSDLSKIQARLLALRSSLSTQIGRYLPSPEAELVAGILWGEKANLPKGFSNALKSSGVMHMVVVSGYNISVIAALMLSGFAVLGRRSSALVTVLGIIVFTLLTGAEAPSVRAAIMGGLMVLGQLIGRERTALRLLIISAVIMLIVNPLWAEDLGFRLSFLATLGILVFGGTSSIIKKSVETPHAASQINELRQRKSLKEMFSDTRFGTILLEPQHVAALQKICGWIEDSPIYPELKTTLTAQILTWPLLATNFGTLSLISPVTNMLVGWTVPYLMALGALLTLASAVSSLLAQMISLVLLVPATFFVETVTMLAKVPGAVVTLKVGTEFIVVYYVITLVIVIKRFKSQAQNPK